MQNYLCLLKRKYNFIFRVNIKFNNFLKFFLIISDQPYYCEKGKIIYI